jgi:hypothetical protein
MIPSLDAAFDSWVRELADSDKLMHARLTDRWRRLLADKRIGHKHRNPLFICRQLILVDARALGYAGATR